MYAFQTCVIKVAAIIDDHMGGVNEVTVKRPRRMTILAAQRLWISPPVAGKPVLRKDSEL
jgi:hypothetical protein